MKAQELRFAVLATDVVLFSLHEDRLLVRLITTQNPHFKGMRALPGGLIGPTETADEAAKRHIEAKTSVSSEKVYIEQLYTFSEIDRDPRGRVVAVAYLGFVPWEKLSEAERGSTSDARWSPLKDARGLAYDHDEIVKIAVARLRSRVTYTTLLQKLLPKEFTLTELEHAYEAVLGADLDKRNFRKKILKLDILKEVPNKKSGGAFRPAQLYRFATDRVIEIEVI